MGYDFYCLHCGRTLNQDSPEKGKQVLFDMWPLFAGGAATGGSHIIKFRLTPQEFSQLFTGQKDEDDYYSCKLSFSQIAQYISNENNLNDPEIASLTMKDIREYCDNSALGGRTQTKDGPKLPAQNNYSLDDAMEEEEAKEEEDAATDVPAKKNVKPAAILALENKNTAIINDALTETSLIDELSYFLNAIPEEKAEDADFEFYIFKISQKCIGGSSVDTGYIFRRSYGKSTEKAVVVNDARVCAKCGAGVFDGAGTAEHRAITFIGQPSSGKTSTILAVASYVKSLSKETSPWMFFADKKGANDRLLERINNLTITLVSPSARLTEDLNDYSEAVAPEKTAVDDRTKAYSAVFKVQYGDRIRFLTLTDLPGELCREGGSIDLEKIVNEFQVAVNCDAYVICFDTRASDTATIDVCSWAEHFQQKRAEKNDMYYAPMMILFTKCKELEERQTIQAGESPRMRTVEERSYLLDDERLAVSADKYSGILLTFNSYANLKRAYNAILRCSPFGFNAEKKAKMAERTEEDKEAYKQQHRPRNVEKLLHWLLCVTGCIPVEARIYSSGNDLNPAICTSILHRAQYRSENPESREEAAARCALFSNPGSLDGEMRANYHSRWDRTVLRIKAFVRKDSNLPTNVR